MSLSIGLVDVETNDDSKEPKIKLWSSDKAISKV